MTVESPGELKIEKLLNNGCGMARLPDGRVVFVANALPGERFTFSGLARRRGVYWATEPRRIRDSPDRTAPPCPHDAACGGCRLLHIRREREAGYKTRYLADVLIRIAKLSEPDIHMADFPWTGSRIRAKFQARNGRLGFLAPDSNRIAQLETCAVLPASLNALLPKLSERVRSSGFEGDLFAATQADGTAPVLAWQPTHPGERSNSRSKRREQAMSGKGSDRNGYTADQLHVSDAAGTMLLRNSMVIDAVGSDSLAFDWCGHRVRLRPDAFFQANPASWPTFWSWMRRLQQRYGPKTLWDVHAGAGFLSAALTGVGLWCTEPEPSAAREAAKLQGFSPLHVISDTAESALIRGMIPPVLDAAVLDPPRTGLEAALRDHLTTAGPPVLLYISCDMGSFARDLRQLLTAYRLDSPIYAVNLNPGTLRLETAVFLVRQGSLKPA